MPPQPIIRPPPLERGHTVGVFTPSTPAHCRFPEKHGHAIAQLEACGFNVREGRLTARRADQGYRSGSPRERAAEFMELVNDADVHALMSTIGGSNSSSMIPYLDFDAIRAHPKVICGYSDVTSLHLAILAYSRVSTFYGPAVLPSFGEWPTVLPETASSFLDACQRHRQGNRALQAPERWSNQRIAWNTDAWRSDRRFEPNPGWRALAPGVAEAPILVANLSTLTAAAGTSYFPELAGIILAIESMDAPMAVEERHLRHLELMGVFDVIAGLIVGKPEQLDLQGAPFGHDELLLEVVGKRSYPIVSNFDCSHTHPMLTIAELTPVELRVEADDVRLRVLQPMVQTP